MSKNSLILKSFIQALGVTFYCAFVGVFFWKGNEIFGRVPNYLGPVAFLVLFIVSGLTCGLIVFYKPYNLFFEGKKKEALNLVLYTTGWLLLFFVALLLSAFFLRNY